jgi:hypothetical protein
VADVAVALLRGLVAVQSGVCEDAVAHRGAEGGRNTCMEIYYYLLLLLFKSMQEGHASVCADVCHSYSNLCKRVTPRSVLFAPSTRGVLLPTRRQTRVIARFILTGKFILVGDW